MNKVLHFLASLGQDDTTGRGPPFDHFQYEYVNCVSRNKVKRLRIAQYTIHNTQADTLYD